MIRPHLRGKIGSRAGIVKVRAAHGGGKFLLMKKQNLERGKLLARGAEIA